MLRTTTTSRTDEVAIITHLPIVEECASAIAAEARSRHYGAEFDDLRQEGMIAVWLDERKPEEKWEPYIIRKMYDYVKFLGKQRGAARGRARVVHAE